jgi:WD40 repeat protein
MIRDLIKNHPNSPIDEDFARGTLRLMESLHREMALLVLADWQKLDLFVPELYQPLSTLTKPSWGVWNWIIQELRNARKKVLYKADKELRNKFEQLESLNHVLETLTQRVPTEEIDQLKPLADFFNQPCKRLTLSAPLEWGIQLRNRIAHDLPDDPGWWAEVARVLKPLLSWLAEQDWIPAKVTYPSPWFYQDQGQIHHFNGLEGKRAVRYIPVGEGPPLVKEELLSEFSLALAALLGGKEKQEKNIKRLLEEMTPEEIRGVLMGDFLVGAPIGEGAFATVHKAIHLSTGAQVAVKILKDASDEETRDRFRREAELLARMNHHHILIVYDYGESTWHLPRNISLKSEVWFQEFKNTNLKHYIAMEWIDGLSLDQIFHLQKIDPDASLAEALRNSQKLGVLLDGWKALLSQGESPPMPEWEATLKEEIRILPRAKERLNQDWLTTWFREAALALQYIHDQGMVHRDLKPSNLMITRDGRLKVMDFGIARNLAEGKTMMTVTGATLGTPAYMSPEQIRAQSVSLEIGPSSDIYSLCATFYELYTRSRCYDHDTTDNFTIQTSKLQGILPERPKERNRSLPWELNMLLLGGMEQEPADRIENMQNLAADLQRFQIDESIQYRRPSLIRRIRLTYRRNTALVNTVITFLAILVIGTSISFYNINQQKNIAQQERKLAQENENEANHQKSIVQKREEEARLTLASIYAREGDKARNEHSWSSAIIYYQKSLEQADNPAARIGAANTFSSFSPELGSFWQMAPATALSFSPDGRILACTSFDKKVHLWNLRNGREYLSLEGHTADVTSISFSPDGKTLASASFDKTIRIWAVGSGKELAVLKGHNDIILSVTFSSDGKTLASASVDKTIHIWDLQNTIKRLVLKGHYDNVYSVAFSPDGKTLASGSTENIRIWDIASGKEINLLRGHTAVVRMVAFRPYGKTLVSFSSDNTARIWEWPSGEVLKILKGQSAETAFVASSRDSETIASVSKDKVRLWDVGSGKELTVLRQTFGRYFAAFSPDGNTLATSSSNGFRLWDVTSIVKGRSATSLSDPSIPMTANSKEAPKVLQGHADEVSYVSFSPDGNTLASTSTNGAIRLWRASDGQETAVLKGHTDSVLSIAFSADSKVLVSSGRDNRVRLWDVNRGNNLMVLKDQAVSFFSMSPFSPDGKILASVSLDKVIHLWDVNSHKEIKQLKGQSDNMPPVSFSPDGKLLASNSNDNSILLWDLAGGGQLVRLKGHSEFITSFIFSPDGNTLASASLDKTVYLWDVAARKKSAVLKGHTDNVNLICFSPDGKILVSTSNDKTIRFWDIKEGKETSLFKHGFGVTHLTFSPDGKTLAVASVDYNIYLLSAENGRLLTVLKGHQQAVTSISFSPDGKTLASSSDDETVRLWPLGTADLPSLLDRLNVYSNLGLSYKLDLDGQFIPKDTEELTLARLEAARNGNIPWLTGGGKRDVEFYKNQLQQIKAVKKKRNLLEKEVREKKHDFTAEQALWLAKYLPGAALSDGLIVDEENRLIQSWIDILDQDAKAMEIYKNIINSQQVPDIDLIDFSWDFTTQALKTIFYICSQDLEIHIKEIEYINQVSKAFSVTKEIRNRFMRKLIVELQHESLMTIKDKLDQAERYWLAVLIDKLIGADGNFNYVRELVYMEYIDSLLITEPEVSDFAENKENIKLEMLPKIELPVGLSLKILRFLAIITISEKGLDEQGLNIVKIAAELLKIEPDKVTEIISGTKAMSIWFD